MQKYRFAGSHLSVSMLGHWSGRTPLVRVSQELA
jgi:hypothetical protein